MSETTAGLPGATYTGTRDVPLEDLTRYPGNPRRGDVESIRASIRRHGQYRSLVVRDTGDSLVVLAGNHTSDALRAEGRTTARCEVITCDDDTARRINLADNKLAELGFYDEEDLAAALAALDGDLEGTGWSQQEVTRLLTAELPEGFAAFDESIAEALQPTTHTCPQCGHTFTGDEAAA
ncbi:ParB N-terminal domain-containing protein (plasmid) [Streptomyces sp. NA02950]|uniref:ParB/RepB/Spo0J family partition protein n=1 Tax=Streptomyces sp. NA02950 TaxID=2742137 RepID=UPI001590C5B6|nr:ParB N-terminal domain-containing protein [Streptomyces sp. NA02950]QKV98282.1 ParB N-terminal domain-containing protein [Streptomyces sp. NA02950]